MVSKTEKKELEAMILDMCTSCADHLRGWVEAQRGKAARKRKPSIALGALDKAAFIRALTACGKVAKRAMGAAIQGVALYTGIDGTTLEVTDGEVFVSRRFPLTTSPGRHGVFDSRALLRWLRSRKAKGIDTVAIDDRGVRIVMGGESATFKSLGDPEGVWPKPPDGELREMARLPAADLRRMIKRVSFATTDAVMRYAMNSVNLHSYKGGFYAAALDGRRLAIAGPVGKAAKGKMLMPLFAANITADLLADIDGDVSVCTIKQGKMPRCIAVESGDLQVRVREVEGAPPNYREVIPVYGGVRVDVDRAALLAAVNDAAVFRLKDQYGDDNGNSFRLIAALGGLVLRPRSADFSGRSIKVAGKFYGKRYAASVLQPAFLQDALKALDEPLVSVVVWPGFQDDGRCYPIVIRVDGFCYVVMPFGANETEARRKRHTERVKAAAESA